MCLLRHRWRQQLERRCFFLCNYCRKNELHNYFWTFAVSFSCHWDNLQSSLRRNTAHQDSIFWRQQWLPLQQTGTLVVASPFFSISVVSSPVSPHKSLENRAEATSSEVKSSNSLRGADSSSTCSVAMMESIKDSEMINLWHLQGLLLALMLADIFMSEHVWEQLKGSQTCKLHVWEPLTVAFMPGSSEKDVCVSVCMSGVISKVPIPIHALTCLPDLQLPLGCCWVPKTVASCNNHTLQHSWLLLYTEVHQPWQWEQEALPGSLMR